MVASADAALCIEKAVRGTRVSRQERGVLLIRTATTERQVTRKIPDMGRLRLKCQLT